MNAFAFKNYSDNLASMTINQIDLFYENNGGSVVAIGGDDFALIVADTRLSSGININTNDQDRLFQLTSKAFFGSTGCWADTLALVNIIKIRVQMYEQNNSKSISTEALAQMISVLLYNRRFCPYFITNILAGLDMNGNGVIYSFDPIGSMACLTHKAAGNAVKLMQPVLDNQIGEEYFSLESAKTLVIDIFISAAERSVYIGDSIIMKIIQNGYIEVLQKDLRVIKSILVKQIE